MVYCGKPSKGCQSCRDRKTRCDKVTPSCTQCIRASRTCPGYRSQLDLMFRNESTAVIDKAKSRERAKAKAKSAATSRSPPVASAVSVPFLPKTSSNSILGKFLDDSVIIDNEGVETSRFRLDPCQGPFVRSLIPSLHLFPTVEERGLGYFAANSSTWLRNFDLVETICSSATTDEHLLASISAVGLASYANSIHAPELMIRARKDYVAAIQLTNAALKSAIDVKKDSTLFAVMILSIFETVTGNNERSLAAWTEHINGAAALVKLRGQEQFNTHAGKRMFLQVTSNLMLSCIQRTIPMPEHIVALRKSAERFMDKENPAWRLSSVIIDFTIFRASIQDSQIVGPQGIIEAALEIDQRFISVFQDLPDEWQYNTIYTEENPHLIWNGSYHVYKEFWIAHIWNGMRTCRILLHEIIRDQLLFASSSLIDTPFSAAECLAQNQSSEEAMIKMRDDILGSVPHHTQNSIGPPSALLEGSRSYFVLWPLYLAGAMDLTTQPIREWAIKRLRDIGETVGLRQALVIAEYLISRKHIAAWGRKALIRPKRLENWMNTDPGADHSSQSSRSWDCARDLGMVSESED